MIGDRPSTSSGPETRAGTVLLGVLALTVISVALLGPFLPLGSATAVRGAPFEPPGRDHLLGTELLGRDVLARLATGGQSLLLQALGATVAASVVGLSIGIWAGMSRSPGATGVVRIVDGVSAVPALLLLLLLASGAPGDDRMIAVAIALVSIPFSVRVIRQQTRTVAATPYATLAELRGDRWAHRVRYDILPGIRAVAVSEAGIRFVAALQIAASAGFLGLGAGAPAANWGRMVRENTVGITQNPLAVLLPAALVAALAIGVTLVIDRMAEPVTEVARR